MKKLVYLFELDSVIKDDNGINKGRRAILNEIIKNGNTVVLTMNQMVDSAVFTGLMADQEIYKQVLLLFKKGYLCTSMYSEYRTPVQYMKNAIDKCAGNVTGESFEFTNLPINKGETKKLEMIHRALDNCDLSEIKEHINGLDNNNQNDSNVINEYEYLLRVIELIIIISTNAKLNLRPKTTNKNFVFFLRKIRSLSNQISVSSKIWNDNIEKALVLLDNVEKCMSSAEQKERSNWFEKITPMNSGEVGDIARLLVNLSYNYTLEESITGVVKHYDDNDFENSFKTDLEERINYTLNDEKKYENTNKNDWNVAARIAEFIEEPSPDTGGYEDSFKTDRVKWRLRVLWEMAKSVILIIVYIMLFLMIEFLLSLLEGFLVPIFEHVLLIKWVAKILTICLFGIINALISRKLPDIVECFVKLWLCILVSVDVFGGKYESYRRNR